VPEDCNISNLHYFYQLAEMAELFVPAEKILTNSEWLSGKISGKYTQRI
jgi:hypothetical protein